MSKTLKIAVLVSVIWFVFWSTVALSSYSDREFIFFVCLFLPLALSWGTYWVRKK